MVTGRNRSRRTLFIPLRRTTANGNLFLRFDQIQKYSGNIKEPIKESGKPEMAYFFSILEDLLDPKGR